jgi:pimeloyl-ACP methyl ester carboxylesterase
MSHSGIEFSDIEFLAGDVTLRGWFVAAETEHEQAPVVVMAHGLSAVKEMYLDEYARVFAQAGLHVLVFDHRNFGDSDGRPRQEIDPVAQNRDYRHAITYVTTRSEIDPARIGVWGSSFSGGHALSVAAIDRRVRAVVAQVPFVSGHGNLSRLVRADYLPLFRSRFHADRRARFDGGDPEMVAVVDPDPSAAVVLPSADSWEWFSRTAKERAPSWRNEITLRSVEMLGEYEPQAWIHRISPTPLLMIVAENDVVAPSELAFEAYERAREPKQLVIAPGGHFGAYTGPGFELTAGAARDHFVRHLAG